MSGRAQGGAAPPAARLIIAGTHSGAGKTTLTAGLIAALRRRGLRVQPFKVGPDYIDPGYHSLAAGRASRNLDTWMLTADRVRLLFARAAANADIAVIEGVMGLFDGASYTAQTGSTAEVARLLASPVVCVLDCFALAGSAGALAHGFATFDPDLTIAGFIANRVGGPSHAAGVTAAITQATGLPVFGTIPYTPNLSVPERHLGLIPTAEPGRWQAFIDAAADAVEAALDLDALLTAARSAPPLPAAAEAPVFTAPTERTVVAVARDEAFSFLYADNLDLLRDAGADLAFFSPLHDSAVPENAQALILSGGFPEIYAEQLAANTAMRQAIRAFAANGGRIYAECGGLMALTEALVDADGVSHPMVGVLPGRAVMTGSLTIGYRRAVPAAGSWLLAPGEEVRGHEFHHSRWEGRPPELPAAYHLLTPEGDRIPAGAVIGSVIASYVHLHFWSLPTIAARIVSG